MTDETIWTGCYDAGWKGLITDESFAHPAKFSRNLIGRIYRHMLARGWLAPGMSVVDPFGGVALGALDAMVNGLHWCGVELEPKFHALGNQNIAEWVRRYGHSAGWGSARLLNGDSRRLCEVVGVADCVVGSPPYAQSMESGDRAAHIDFSKCADGRKFKPTPGNQGSRSESYGDTPGQLGSMKAGSVDAVLGSPPYVSGGHHPDQTGAWNTNGRGQGQGKDVAGYGTQLGQLGQMRPGSVEAVVSSPPYEGSETGRPTGKGEHLVERKREALIAAGYTQEYVDGLFTPGRLKHSNMGVKEHYGNSSGQLGNEQGETFWHAAREIVQQCHSILRPGGIAAWVVKSFVRNKQLVDFPGDWQRLCESLGFETVEVVRAMLTRQWEESTLFDGIVQREKKRASFFRRLAEKKGSPRIDWETVLFLRKV